jgi:hypothetical protein
VAKWKLRLFLSFFSVPKPIEYVRHPIARVTVAIMITQSKLCGFRGKKLRDFHSGIFGFDDFETNTKYNNLLMFIGPCIIVIVEE